MRQLKELCDYLEQAAPSVLAEEWDNVGLLAGDPDAPIHRVMACLTITPQTAAEAIERQANLIVTHHPLPFRALKRLVTTTTSGRLLWDLVSHGIAIYSAHTAFDSTTRGINQQLAEAMELEQIVPLVPIEGAPLGAGAGRVGILPGALSLSEVADRLRAFLGIEHLQYVGDRSVEVRRVAIACGAAGEFLAAATAAECNLLVLGETNFHTCLEAEANQIALLLPGHYASERFAVEQLAEVLAGEFTDLEVWGSGEESDPIRHFSS